MFCKCGRMMKNFDGVNFGCSCGGYHYRKDPERERWLGEHGSKTCPVCGRVTLQPGMMPNNGNGHICIHCCAEYEHDESTGRVDLYPLSSQLKPKPDHRGSFTVRVSTVFFLILMVYLAGCAVIVNAEAEALDVYIQSDPLFDDVNDPVNIYDMDRTDTTIGEWERDFGDEMPNGTYFGPFLPPSRFDFNLRPSFFRNSTTNNFDARYTYVMVSGHFNLSQNSIMAGASEWWVRTPISPRSIEAYLGLTMSIFKNVDNASKVRLHGNYSTGLDALALKARAAHNGYCPDIVAEFGCTAPSNSIGEPLSEHPIQSDMMIANDRLYLQVNAVLEPSIDYVISLGFRMPIDSTLTTYLSSAESPSGGWSVVDIGEVYVEPVVGFYTYIDLIDSQKVELPIDLDWSFIFTEGVGLGGLFGKKLYIPANHTLVVYPFFNTSMSGSQYMSFNLPFISDDKVNVTPGVHNVNHDDPWNFSSGDSWFYPEIEYTTLLSEDAAAGSDIIIVDSVDHFWLGKYIRVIDDDHSETNFVKAINGNEVTLYYDLYNDMSTAKNAHVWCWIPMGWNYTDFILFSTNDTLDWATFRSDDRWNVLVEFLFNDPITLTLLCYVEDRPKLLWTQAWFNNTTRNPYYHPYTYGRDEGAAGTHRLHYNVWCSARGTDGQWVIRNGTASGRETYTHYFPNTIHLSGAYYEVVNETDSERVVDVLSRALNFMRDNVLGDETTLTPQGLLLGAFRNAIMKIWNGLSEFGGWVLDGLSNVWESIKRFGNMIYTRIVEFIGKIWNFISDVVDTIASFWDTLRYLVAPIMLIAIIVGGSKMSKKLMTGRGD